MFLRSQCHHTPSQYSSCHTARHTFHLHLRRLAHILLPSTRQTNIRPVLPFSVHASVNVTFPRSSAAFPIAPCVCRRPDSLPDTLYYNRHSLCFSPALILPSLSSSQHLHCHIDIHRLFRTKVTFCSSKSTAPSLWQFHRKKRCFFVFHLTALS